MTKVATFLWRTRVDFLLLFDYLQRTATASVASAITNAVWDYFDGWRLRQRLLGTSRHAANRVRQWRSYVGSCGCGRTHKDFITLIKF
jgi:hypothetical protein